MAEPQREDSLFEQIESLPAIRLPFAAALSTVLAYRPRRRSTPARQLHVIPTQIILAIAGAIVMLVVGASLARAFEIVGAAGLIRYPAKVDDPKDAGVMLSTLALGLASGVGVRTRGAVDSGVARTRAVRPLRDDGVAKETPELKAAIEQTLRRQRLTYELRTAAAEGISYNVRVPLKKDTNAIADAIAGVDPKQSVDVKWEKKKEK